MTTDTPLLSDLGQWHGVFRPAHHPIEGHYITLVPLNVEQHAASLWSSLSSAPDNWRFLAERPFPDETSFSQWVEQVSKGNDPQFFAIVSDIGSRTEAIGLASYLRIDEANGVIEIGNLNFSPLLQRNRMATDALFSLIDHAFALGYRRVEWKCDDQNEPSIQAAKRLGFHYEGTFRQHRVVKGKNRDTAWFAILDHEWTLLRELFLQWLDSSNFDEHGQQKSSLSVMTKRDK